MIQITKLIVNNKYDLQLYILYCFQIIMNLWASSQHYYVDKTVMAHIHRKKHQTVEIFAI